MGRVYKVILSKERKKQMTPRSKIPPTVHSTQLLRSMARRRGIRLETSSKIQQSRSEVLENRSNSQDGHMSQERGDHISQPVKHKDPGIPPPEDIMKPSIDLRWYPRILRWWWRVRGKFRLYRRSLFPKPTQDQQEEKAWLKFEREKDRICKVEGKRYAEQVSKKLGGVRWKMITRDEACSKIFLSLDVNPAHLPDNLLVSKLNQIPFYTTDLAAAIGRSLTWLVGDFGATLVIQRPVEAKPKRRKITVEDLIQDE